MKRIRIGNDINLKWSILEADGNPYAISESIRVFMDVNGGRKVIEVRNFQIDGNKIIFTFPGKTQSVKGVYNLRFIENDGLDGQLTYDAKDAFELVPHSWQEGQSNTPNIEAVSVELTSQISDATPEVLQRKADKVVGGTPGHIVMLTADGNIADSGIARRNSYRRIRHRADYAAEIWFDGVDYEAAKRYFEGEYESSAGACSVFWKNGIMARNFDWPYSNRTGFMVHTPAVDGRHAVDGFSGYLEGLTDAVVDSGAWNAKYELLPFLMSDGINDSGLVCENKGVTQTTGTHAGMPDMNGLFIVRYALDNHTDALEAANDIASNFNVYMPHNGRVDQELHFIFADKNKSVALEFVNNTAVVLQGKTIATNFRLQGTSTNVDGTIDYNTVRAYGQGCERYDAIAGAYTSIVDKDDMITLCEAIKFTNAYAAGSTWLTEFTGVEDELTVQAAKTTPALFADVMADAREKYLNRERNNPETWQTCHTVIYDSSDCSALVYVQEDYSELVLQTQLKTHVDVEDYKTGIKNFTQALGASLGKTITITWNGSIPSFVITDNA